ncbi:MAG: GatB/YqeY domain-containing protein [Xanthobacteraceae bacterium]|nr:GatB/YqeY domain-containing protein [Xanthobacteraceae bacterium]
MLRDDINTGLKEAVKAQDKRRMSTLRLINAAIKDRDIEARGLGRDALTDEELLGLLQKMIKQRQESFEIYEKAGRADLATQEREEIAIISSYLPKQMSEDEVRSVCASVIQEMDAQGLKDMGKCMAALKERYAGKMDFAKASAAVKGILAR